MSMQAREQLVNSPNIFFQRESEKEDLLNSGITQTGLIAMLLEIVNKGEVIEITAVKTDHHDDSGLGTYVHFNGYAVDCWPLKSKTAGDYLDANDVEFGDFLLTVRDSPWLYQIGLAGTAWTEDNAKDAGPTVFQDSGADHVHIGCTNG